ncbi:transporter [Mesobaculum littorinae]|uniref:Transporter n=1 Tax=Mesobaculum littorinae TaxID=2486419 RepID=A0A438AMJ1_9RHOB|nr:TolC family outer membrane protein [Mesobaculum littorinae]RVV99902.1 transporter [Mesobaculum littorinae]
MTLIALPALAPMRAGAETLTDALIAAYRQSGLLDQNRALLRATDEDVAQAVAATRPVISYVLGSTYTNTQLGDELSSSAALSASMTLYDFGRNQLAIDAAKETVLATREALVDIEQQVLFRAVDAYMSVRQAAAVVNLRQNNLGLITRELDAARDRFEVGEVTRTDVSLAEARLAEARSGLAAAQGDLQVAREEYKAAVGNYPGALAQPPAAPQIPDTQAAALSVAVRTHPQIRQAMRQVTVAEINIDRAEAATRPSLSGNARVSVDQDFDDTSSVGIELSGPIYQGGAISSGIRQAQANRDSQRAALYVTRQNVEQAVGNAWAQLSVSIASLGATDEQVRAATLAFRGVQEEATLGARTTLDVLDAEQDLLDARQTRITAEINRYVAIYAVLRSMGLLTVDHLGLGIVTYDPSAYYNAVEDAPLREVSPQGERLDRVLKGLGRN